MHSAVMEKEFLSYFKVTGRAPRSEMWGVLLIGSILGNVLAVILVDFFSRFLPSQPSDFQVGGIAFLAALPLCSIIIPTFVRRLHDLNVSGWWLLLPLIELLVLESGEAIIENTGKSFWWMWLFLPPLGICFFVVFFGMLVVCFHEGTEGANDYGANPLRL